jgi:cation transport ATPase
MTSNRMADENRRLKLPLLQSQTIVQMAIIRLILALAATVFGIASLIHGGAIISGYEHANAEIAESVIAAVLIIAVLGTWIWPQAIRGIALTALGFAVLGTLAGIAAIIIGIGPQSTPDIVFHSLMIIGLLAGLRASWRIDGDATNGAKPNR